MAAASTSDGKDERAKGHAPKQGRFRGYFKESRDPLNSVVLVIPLFVAYQVGILFTGGLRNGVDFMTDLLRLAVAATLSLFLEKVTPIDVTWGYLGLNALVLVGFAVVVFFLRGRGSFRPKLWPALLLESTVYALFFGSAILLLMRSLGLDELLLWPSHAALVDASPALAAGTKEYSPFVALIQSIGAGLYEEIVFRAGLLTLVYVIVQRLPFFGKIGAAVVAIVVSSLVFSAVHHLGSLGDPFSAGVFAYRFFAGVLLSAIFAARGFAVAVYTHAIYDVIVMVFR